MPTNLVGTMKDLAVVQLVSGKNFPSEGELTFTAFWGKKDAVRIDAVKSSIDHMDIHEEFAFPTNMLDERLLVKEHVELFCIYTSPTGTKLNIGSIKIPVSTTTLQEKWYHFTNGSNTFMVDVPSVLVSSYIECDLAISSNLEVEKAKFVRTSVNFTGDVNFNSDLDEISIVEDCDGQKALSSSNGKRLGVTFALDETQDSDNLSFPTKTNKRRRIHSISGSDSDDSVIVEYQGKKRRKLDYLDIASDDEEDVLVMETRHQVDKAVKMRKNINPILNEGNLQDDTKIAAKEEEERKKRLAERKKIYDTIFPENSLDKNLILDFDLTTKEALVSVHPHLVSRLKAHQLKGVKFMWDSCFESLERVDGHPGSGCILAHCMGLGKSLQVVTLVHTVLTHEACQVRRVAVVCPVSTLFNWVNEFTIWLPGDLKLKTYELTDSKTYAERVSVLRQWFSKGGVLIIGYEMYRNLSNRDNEKIDGQLRSTFRHLLIDPGPDLIICDEGHLMKNDGSTLSISMNQISTRRRIILTGTPLQNNLLEYHCMVDFVKPFLLGTKKEFVNRFVNPINNGQAADSNDDDVRLMKRRAHVLHNLLKESVQRLDYTILTPHLPPKYEYVIAVKMSDLQVKLYRQYLKYHSRGGPKKSGRGKGAGLFADFQELSRVWTHPKAMLLSEIRQMGIGKESTASFTPSALFGSIVGDSGNGGDLANDDGWKGRTRRSRGDKPPPKDQLGVTAPMSAPWWFKFVRDEDVENMALSGKLLLLMDILQNCEQLSEKILVFSQSLMTLDVIEEFLAAQQRQQQSSINKNKSSNTEKILGTWIRDKDYFRLDGNCATDLRKTCCDAFNDPSNLRSRLFLISTKAGGLGINLVAANRVIIFDASWNPSHDVQSIFRIYRFGQKKPCYVYRFLAQGTMEEKIYDRQVNKQSLSCRVVDEQQVKRHFNRKDLEDLYAFDGTIKPRRPVLPSTIKDSILIKLLAHRGKDWIATFHEHDSLLENKTEEELDEGERKAAWDDYKNQDAMSTLVP